MRRVLLAIGLFAVACTSSVDSSKASKPSVGTSDTQPGVGALPAGPGQWLGGSAVGILRPGLVIKAGDEALALDANGPFAFTRQVPTGSAYEVVVVKPPPGEECWVWGGAGVVSDEDVGGVSVGCAPLSYAVRGMVEGLVGSVVLRSGSDLLTVKADGMVVFPSLVKSGAKHAVSVYTQPASQSCAVAGGSGEVIASDVFVSVTCTTNRFALGVEIEGFLGGKDFMLEDQAGDVLSPTAGDGLYTFSTQLLDGQPYFVKVVSQPVEPDQTCWVELPSTGAWVAGFDVTVHVKCQ